MLAKLKKVIRWPFVTLITIYQHTLSFDHGPLKVFFPYGYCRYTPCCSEYSKKAIEKHGVIKGMILGSWRILRCNPWSRGGLDEVPSKFKLKLRNK